MAANSMEENLENSNFETNATEEYCEALVNRNYNGSINRYLFEYIVSVSYHAVDVVISLFAFCYHSCVTLQHP